MEEGTNAGLSGWGWADNNYGGLGANIKFASTGSHTLRVQQREDGASIDQIVISPSTYLSARPGNLKNDTTILSASAEVPNPNPTPTPPPGPGPTPPPPGPGPAPAPTPAPGPSPSPSPRPSTPSDNRMPIGYFDEIRLGDGVGRGWALDQDTKSSPTQIHVYIDGPAGRGVLMQAVTTTAHRDDVNNIYTATGAHGFEFTIPMQYRNGQTHSLYVYSIDTSNSAFATLLSGSPKSFALSSNAPVPNPAPIDGDSGVPVQFPDGSLILDRGTIYVIEHGLKRGIVSMAVLEGLGYKLSRVRTGDLSTITAGSLLDKADSRHPRGTLVAHQGTVYYMGANLRYAFPSAEVFLSWSADFADIVPANASDLAIPQGPIVQHR